MPEVDYSEFFLRRDPRKVKEEDKKEIPIDKKPRKKKFSSFISVLLILIVIGGIIFFSVDFFAKGKLIDKVVATFKGNEYNYYLVVTDCASRDVSYAQSLLIKQSGGSGYIIGEDNFSVVYSVYTDRSEANSVSAKNNKSYVMTVAFTSKDVSFYNALFEEIDRLVILTNDYEKGKFSDGEVFTRIKESKDRFVYLLDKTEDEAKRNYLEYCQGSLESLDGMKGTKLSFLSDLRYVVTGMTISLSKTV